MTRQEYLAIARVVRGLPGDRLVIARRFAAMFAERDPDFERNRFLAAALWGNRWCQRGGVAIPAR